MINNQSYKSITKADKVFPDSGHDKKTFTIAIKLIKLKIAYNRRIIMITNQYTFRL